ncbi:tannase [Amorphoplanes digitatis]|nr:tannase [Actinoplanes digitatis]
MVAAVAVLALPLLVPGSAQAAQRLAGAAPASGRCPSLTGLVLPNTTVTSASVVPASGATPPTCRVHATVTHPPTGDVVNIDVWLPAEGWNGRFQGVGGGGYEGGNPRSLAVPVQRGYAAASTDTGHPGGDGGFALDENGRLDWQLIRDFAYLGIHDMTVVGKAVTAAFYGRAARYSYWNGCSTGGRQGLSEAQRYPDDYDGILAAAPAINWSRFIPAEFWPQLVMSRTSNFLPQCKFAAFQAAAVEACDKVGDGVRDGVIGDPARCRFDPRTQIGRATPCGTITARDASVVARILAGPRSSTGEFLWYGLTPGSPFGALANTVTAGGRTRGAPFPIALTHLGTWVQRNPDWDWESTTYEQYDRLFAQSVRMYTRVIGTADPDLRAFQRSGGKVLIWHGQADQLIFPQGTVDYYERVVAAIGGTQRTEDFARLFLAPGVDHCAGGPGPQPADPLGALIGWVERGQAPGTLAGVVRDADGRIVRSRPICRYPEVAAYRGRGPVTEAASFVCRRSRS